MPASRPPVERNRRNSRSFKEALREVDSDSQCHGCASLFSFLNQRHYCGTCKMVRFTSFFSVSLSMFASILTHLLPPADVLPQMCSQAIVFWHARLRALSERVHLRALLRGNTQKRNRTGGRIRCALFNRANFPASQCRRNIHTTTARLAVSLRRMR